VIPPPKQRSARSRRRRRAWIALAVVVLIGALSVFGGIAATRWYQRWNSHVPDLVGQTISQATARIEHDHYKRGRISQEFSETALQDTVISTEPGKGARLEQGSEIDLTVSLGPERVQVPDVHGQDLSVAESALQARDIRFAPPTEVASRTVGKGKVITVTPKAGTSVKRGATVHLTISSGPPMVTVPYIAQNTAFEDAQKTLKDAKLKVHEIDEYSDTVPKGGVISTSPGGIVIEGTTIETHVSLGPEFVTMPSIPLLTPIGDAKDQLEGLGLTVRRQVFGGHDTGNRVIDQNIPAGQRVHVGTEVILTVI
jgi:serine/threonine-protein kinase